MEAFQDLFKDSEIVEFIHLWKKQEKYETSDGSLGKVRRNVTASSHFVLEDFKKVIKLLSEYHLAFLFNSLDVFCDSFLEFSIRFKVNTRPLDVWISNFLLRLVHKRARELINVLEHIQ